AKRSHSLCKQGFQSRVKLDYSVTSRRALRGSNLHIAATHVISSNLSSRFAGFTASTVYISSKS
ncbi:hypothetical protein J6590_088645, partial [Homalodisca vitripennis]